MKTATGHVTGECVELNNHSASRSPYCRQALTHYSCAGAFAAWDPVLDRAADCACPCHSAPVPVSLECQDEFWHYACPGQDAAVELASGRPTDCRCGCHSGPSGAG